MFNPKAKRESLDAIFKNSEITVEVVETKEKKYEEVCHDLLGWIDIEEGKEE